MMDITMIFHGANIAKQISGYLGIIETMDAKLDRLAGAEFEAAIRSLEQAATSQCERDSLLREARSRFNKAISLENSERLALSYIGLALCHFQLGDDYNGREALRAVNLIKLEGETLAEDREETKAILEEQLAQIDKVSGLTAAAAIYVIYAMVLTYEVCGVIVEPYATARREKFRELKRSVQRFLETSFRFAHQIFE
jgi:hypothetical protein